MCKTKTNHHCCLSFLLWREEWSGGDVRRPPHWISVKEEALWSQIEIWCVVNRKEEAQPSCCKGGSLVVLLSWLIMKIDMGCDGRDCYFGGEKGFLQILGSKLRVKEMKSMCRDFDATITSRGIKIKDEGDEICV